MTNTGKLLIVGLLVIDAGIAGYLLFPKEDERAPTATSEVIGRITGATDSDSERGAAHVAGGNVMPAQPAVTATPAAPAGPGANPGASVPQAPAATAATTIAPPQAVPAGPPPSPSPAPYAGTTDKVTVAPPPATPSQSASIAPPSVAALAPNPNAAPDSGQTAAGRIDNTSPPTTQPTASAHARSSKQTVQALALQKAQPKPALGPRVAPTQARQRDEAHPNGSNPVAAMLTDQLVKESAKPDPSLPMPSGVAVPLSPDRSPPSVGSAMTDQLVRESSRVTPMQQSAEPPILKH
ncbi:hypothetical protein [Paraburkholderia antibiotica]|uniref:Extensin n=1 Tax=Paraburkholderia antibiotica TaxID=2728839 RepID=A0A7Y0A0Y8_9BURK|nr:hypothetical protein [Paraburkholderia antibiotica]NML34462.1 hypothetical protein [Paraburkholderia antibiotica]